MIAGFPVSFDDINKPNEEIIVPTSAGSVEAQPSPYAQLNEIEESLRNILN